MSDPFRIISEEAAGYVLLAMALAAILWDTAQRIIERFG